MLHFFKKNMYPTSLIIDDLIKNPLFINIKKEAVRDLLNEIDFIVKKFDDEEIILFQGSKYDSLYILLQGAFYGEMIHVTGKSIIIGFFEAPYCISCGILFSDENIIPSTLKAKKQARFVIIDKNYILRMCKKNEQFLKNFLTAMSNTSSFLAKKLYFMKFESIKEKLIHYIISISNNRDRFKLPLTLENLGAFFGVERVSLSRVFHELEEQQLIKKEKKEIIIIDREKLLSLL